ncbi:hypothetical protein EPD60_07720 [Flaviaesturariibacter flavus]|uniref:Uncharacterized protein n=1 Tax=Flaviaesturariibacter flavus TaxID=2502780 RepID=A0A4R1BFB3_9BACT|nr:hypothetical protein [Flaviaesturariibacter flavus]TCJ15839.1 hypothetical protein EPD60_07720 [Flaviaesturariibacter flavus]
MQVDARSGYDLSSGQGVCFATLAMTAEGRRATRSRYCASRAQGCRLTPPPRPNAVADLLTRTGDSVLLGFEIREDLLGDFPARRTEAALLASPFFQGVTGDGRNSEAWKNLLLTAARNPRIGTFFFDNREAARDSFMALRISAAMEAHPTWKEVTISGNQHNKVRPYNGQPKAAYYLLQAGGRALNGRVCSVNIAYAEVSAWVNMGDGLKLHSGTSDNIYAQAAPSDNYLLFLDPKSDYDYNAILFVRKVTASRPLK